MTGLINNGIYGQYKGDPYWIIGMTEAFLGFLVIQLWGPRVGLALRVYDFHPETNRGCRETLPFGRSTIACGGLNWDD